MKKADFLVDLEDVLQREEACNENDVLENYDEWDSLSKMATMAYFDKMLRKYGIFDQMEANGIKDGDTVNLYDFEFDYVK